MEKYSQEWYEELYKWIKQREFRADQKYWSMVGVSYCPTSADLLLEEKNSIINDER